MKINKLLSLDVMFIPLPILYTYLENTMRKFGWIDGFMFVDSLQQNY